MWPLKARPLIFNMMLYLGRKKSSGAGENEINSNSVSNVHWVPKELKGRIVRRRVLTGDFLSLLCHLRDKYMGSYVGMPTSVIDKTLTVRRVEG